MLDTCKVVTSNQLAMFMPYKVSLLIKKLYISGSTEDMSSHFYPFLTLVVNRQVLIECVLAFGLRTLVTLIFQDSNEHRIYGLEVGRSVVHGCGNHQTAVLHMNRFLLSIGHVENLVDLVTRGTLGNV